MSHATSKFILEEKLTYLRVKDNWTIGGLGDWSHLAGNQGIDPTLLSSYRRRVTGWMK